MNEWPRRLVEVDLPIKRISFQARREKSIRHGHISTLHIWWARRPLAACRAVICASLWPDPADPACPETFRVVVRDWARDWATNHVGLQSKETFDRFKEYRANPDTLKDPLKLRAALLDFIADFSNWDSASDKNYLKASRRLTDCAFEALKGHPGHALVADPFAGGGSIPLESIRVGADTFASDINPVAVLLNKLVVECIPRFGPNLIEAFSTWGAWLLQKCEQRLTTFFPDESDGGQPIAYIWARTIRCEGPSCGTEIPLLRSLWLSKKHPDTVGLKIVPDKSSKTISFEIVKGVRGSTIGSGTVRRSSATCPICGYTTNDKSVRAQFEKRLGGSRDARLIAVVAQNTGARGRYYRLPTSRDFEACDAANSALEQLRRGESYGIQQLPSEALPYLRSIFNINLLGVHSWVDLFSPRQLATILTLTELVREAQREPDFPSGELGKAVALSLACAVDRSVDQQTTLVTWIPNIQAVSHTFVRQALGITWDFCEPNPIGDSGGNVKGAINWVSKVLQHEVAAAHQPGHVELASATSNPLPDDAVDVFSRTLHITMRFHMQTFPTSSMSGSAGCC